MTKAMVNNNTCPSVMAEVPHKLAVVEPLADTLMLCSLPTLCLWKVFICESLKGIIHHHH
jgi:hypothetical protein